jgi:hypothetical protein
VVTVNVVVTVTMVGESEPLVVAVAVEEDPVGVEITVEVLLVDEELGAKADAEDAEATDQKTAPRTQNSIQGQTFTAGCLVLMYPKYMIVITVAINCRDTKTQQPALIQKEEL